MGEPAVLIVCRERVINQGAYKTHTFRTPSINKIPSLMEVAPAYTIDTVYTVDNVDMVYTVDTVYIYYSNCFTMLKQ